MLEDTLKKADALVAREVKFAYRGNAGWDYTRPPKGGERYRPAANGFRSFEEAVIFLHDYWFRCRKWS